MSTSFLPKGTRLTSETAVYTIDREIGSGGFGITYVATMPTTQGNIHARIDVAIKEHFPMADCERSAQTMSITYSQTASERVQNSLREFIDEARTLQRLAGTHPNIVTVNEVFEANNTAYYVMEYLRGKTLKQYVTENGRLSVKETLSLIMPVVDAVASLHGNRFTHLDIKPSNIILAEDTDTGNIRPTLIDFGLAKHYNADGSATSTIMAGGFSDGYAPVEQYSGITRFSPAVDVYSLSATILFCLTGKTPPRSIELTPAKVTQLIPADVPERLRRIITFGLSFQAIDRIPDARQLYLELKPIADSAGVSSEPVKAAPPVADRSQVSDRTVRSDRGFASSEARRPDFDADETVMSSPAPSNVYSGNTGPSLAYVPPVPPVSPEQENRTYVPPVADNYGNVATNTSVPKWIWVVIALLVVALAVAGYFIYKSGSSGSSRSSYYDDEQMVVIPEEDTPARVAEPARVADERNYAEENTSSTTYLADGERTPDLGFHDLKGPVKSMSNQWGANVPFNTDGEWTGTWHDKLGARSFDRDSRGRITVEHYSNSSNGPGEKVYSWSGNNIVSMVDDNIGESVYYTYDANDNMETMSINKNGKEILYSFSNYRKDSHGNWTSRSFTCTTTDGYNVKTSSGRHKRSITYYN